MSDLKHLRKQLFVDPKVQGALILRVIMYWVFCLLTIMIMLLCWRIFTGPARLFYKHFGDLWFFYGPALVASFLLLPLVVIDIIRMSNQFAGPMMRLRRAMCMLAQGEHVESVRFRDGDFWQDFAEEFNKLAASIQAERATAETQHEEEQTPVGVGAG